MGRPKKHHNHSNILPFAEKTISLSFNAEPKGDSDSDKVAAVFVAPETVSEVAALPPPKTTYWVVLEERRAALNGALVTVAKGKIVKSPDIAKRLIEQKVPLEEKSL